MVGAARQGSIAALEADGRGLKAAEPSDVAAFLNQASHSGAFRDWRFRQCVQARGTAGGRGGVALGFEL